MEITSSETTNWKGKCKKEETKSKERNALFRMFWCCNWKTSSSLAYSSFNYLLLFFGFKPFRRPWGWMDDVRQSVVHERKGETCFYSLRFLHMTIKFPGDVIDGRTLWLPGLQKTSSVGHNCFTCSRRVPETMRYSSRTIALLSGVSISGLLLCCRSTTIRIFLALRFSLCL